MSYNYTLLIEGSDFSDGEETLISMVMWLWLTVGCRWEEREGILHVRMTLAASGGRALGV